MKQIKEYEWENKWTICSVFMTEIRSYVSLVIVPWNEVSVFFYALLIIIYYFLRKNWDYIYWSVKLKSFQVSFNA